MKTVQETLKIILAGSKAESTSAARSVRKLVYGSAGWENEYREIQDAVECAPLEFEKIVENWRQENFVSAISIMYFLHNRENEHDFLFHWNFKLLEHSSGTIRFCAVKMIDHEIGPLTVHLRHPEYLEKKALVEINKAENLLLSMYVTLNNLAVKYNSTKYKKIKYVQDLPASVYKSVEMLLGELNESCGKEFFSKFFDISKSEF